MENASLVDEYGYVEDAKVFLKGYLDYPARQIGEVKRTEQEALDYFKNRFAIAQSKVAQLQEEVTEAQNKGSYLTKLLQLRRKLIGFDAIGNFPPLLDRLDYLEDILSGLIYTNQLKNLEIKRALIGEAEVIAGSDDWKPTAEALQEIKADPRFKSIRVVVMTTSQADEDIAQTYNLSAASYIMKPVTFEGLLEVIRVLGKYWLEIVHLPDSPDDSATRP